MFPPQRLSQTVKQAHSFQIILTVSPNYDLSTILTLAIDNEVLFSEEQRLDAEFGDTEAVKNLEHSLVRKLDRRMTILILIYVLNCEFIQQR